MCDGEDHERFENIFVRKYLCNFCRSAILSFGITLFCSCDVLLLKKILPPILQTINMLLKANMCSTFH